MNNNKKIESKTFEFFQDWKSFEIGIGIDYDKSYNKPLQIVLKFAFWAININF